jgi:hypothetical protein
LRPGRTGNTGYRGKPAGYQWFLFNLAPDTQQLGPISKQLLADGTQQHQLATYTCDLFVWLVADADLF